LESTLDDCRWLYNKLLEQRKTLWEIEKKNLSYYDQCGTVRKFREEYKTVDVYSMVLGDVALRIDLAFKAFFRRVKAGKKPGYPRFRSKDRYDSFTYRQSGWKIIEGNKVRLSMIGTIKMIYHRPIEGKIKTCTVKRTVTGKWYVSFSCEVESSILSKSDKYIGIDVGLKSFAVLSNGSKIKNPRFFKAEEKLLAKAQRRLSTAKKGTAQRYKRRLKVAKVYENITNKRTNFAHQESRKLVNQYGIICIEDLNINKMVEDNYKCLNKSIMDAAWSQFGQFLSYKAVEAGRKVIKVNPAYTTQDCSGCGHRQAKKLSDRTHKCTCCGLVLDRDHNAAINILTLGLKSLGLSLDSTS
jgi:putative transposase